MADPLAELFALDRARPAERSLILDSWSRSFWKSATARAMHPTDYWEAIRYVSETLLVECDTFVLRSVDRPELVVGWSCGTPGELHYVYVKREALGVKMRRQGLGWRLVRAHGEVRTYTHRVAPGSYFLDRAGVTYSARFWEDV